MRAPGSGVVQRVDSDLLAGGIVLSSAWFTRYAGKPERPLADKEQYGLCTLPPPLSCAGWLDLCGGRDRRCARRTVRGLRILHAGAGHSGAGAGPSPQYDVVRREVGRSRSAALSGRGPCGVAGRGRAEHRGAGRRQRDLPRRSARGRQRHGCSAPAPQGRPDADRLAAGPVRRHALLGRPADAPAGRAHGPGAARDRLQRKPRSAPCTPMAW